MTDLQVEIRVVGVVPAELLEELEGVQVVTESVETVLQGSLAGPGRADRHDQPAAGPRCRAARSPSAGHRDVAITEGRDGA